MNTSTIKKLDTALTKAAKAFEAAEAEHTAAAEGYDLAQQSYGTTVATGNVEAAATAKRTTCVDAEVRRDIATAALQRAAAAMATAEEDLADAQLADLQSQADAARRSIPAIAAEAGAHLVAAMRLIVDALGRVDELQRLDRDGAAAATAAGGSYRHVGDYWRQLHAAVLAQQIIADGPPLAAGADWLVTQSPNSSWQTVSDALMGLGLPAPLGTTPTGDKLRDVLRARLAELAGETAAVAEAAE